MAKKKTRRARRAEKQRRPPRVYPAGAPTSATTRRDVPEERATPREQPSRSEQTARVDFSQQYAYVREDLKRIAIVAGVLFAGMFALTFVIR